MTYSNPPHFFHEAKEMMEPKPIIQFKLNGESTSNSEIDKLELQACYRALGNLHSLLTQQSVLDLLSGQIDEGNTYFESLIAKSDGGFQECRTYFKVAGVSVRDVQMITSRWLLCRPAEELAARYVLPTHPEHYAAMHGPGSPLSSPPDWGVEMIGDHMAKLQYIDLEDRGQKIPRWMLMKRDYDYGMVEMLVAKLTSGSRFFYVMNEFMDFDGGCKVRLRTFFPSAAPWTLIKQHAQHLAIEFRNLLTMVDEAVQELEDSY
ncbi:unnamed protein product [Penicillium salamii]|nr:unnamed protein product [Penicillium salamii]